MFLIAQVTQPLSMFLVALSLINLLGECGRVI